jgi:hypothetical protein
MKLIDLQRHVSDRLTRKPSLAIHISLVIEQAYALQVGHHGDLYLNVSCLMNHGSRNYENRTRGGIVGMSNFGIPIQQATAVKDALLILYSLIVDSSPSYNQIISQSVDTNTKGKISGTSFESLLLNRVKEKKSETLECRSAKKRCMVSSFQRLGRGEAKPKEAVH